MAIVGYVLCLVSFVCAIFILIEAFKSAVWKGIVGLFCGLYLLYFAFTEFQHEKKGMIIAGWLVAGILGGVLINMGAPRPV